MSLSPSVLALQAVLAAKPGAVGDPLASAQGGIYKVMGKMFAILTTGRVEGVILQCDPHLAEILREQYEGVGHRSHLDRRFWISVNFDEDVPASEIERLASHSYD